MNIDNLTVVVAGILILIGLALFLPLKRSQSKHSPAGYIFRDDDRYWRGFLYYNPDDPDLFVPKRFAIGWTVNFGHPGGKVFVILMLILLLLPLVIHLPGIGPATGCHTLGCVP